MSTPNETPVEQPQAQPEAEKPQAMTPKSRNALLRYMTILFAVAFLVVTVSLVISMRLHVLVFASGQGVPLVGIVYDPKVSAFLDHLGQDLYLPLAETNAASLCDLIDAALAERHFERENIRHLRHLANKNEEVLRGLLDEDELPDL